MRFIWMFFALFAVGCSPLIPATTPPQLDYTPGAFVTIDDTVFDAGIFRANYPDGWRIVKTSVASAPLEVVFVAPDNSMTIRIMEGDHLFPESTPEPDRYERREWLDLSRDVTVTLVGESPLEQQDNFDAVFDAVLASIVAN